MMNDLTKLENENQEQYIYRVNCLIKEGKYKNWAEVTPIVNKELFGEDFSKYKGESAWRKDVASGIKYYENVFAKKENDEYIDELKKAKLELEKERVKIQSTKLELNRNIRHESRFELFYENVESAKERLPIPELHPITQEENGKEYLLGFGDVHFGSTFKSKNNEYSREECKRRFSVLLGQLIPYIEKEQISKLKIVNVGDTLQGILRMTDLQINDIPVTEALVEVSRLLALFLNNLSSYCEIEYYHVPRANHTQTRNLGSKASELANEDLETVIVNYISDLVMFNDRINVISDIKSDYLDFTIAGFEVVAMHGHQLKNTKNVIKDLSNLHRKFYSYAILGHTHASNEIIVGEENNNNIEVLTVPSFIGSDPYSDKLMVGSKAMAKMFVFDEKYGHIEDKNFILN